MTASRTHPPTPGAAAPDAMNAPAAASAAGTGPIAGPIEAAVVPDGPRAVVDALAASGQPFLLGVRHHSPALAAVIPALLDASGADVVCVELPADFQDWLTHLADPETTAPVALAGAGTDGRLAFYPFADFSPELAAIRWARDNGAEVLCCDLPLDDAGWTAGGGSAESVHPEATGHPAPAPVTAAGRSFADALAAAGTGRAGEDMWDRAVEVMAPGCTPEAVRRAALGVGWALRSDAAAAGGVPATDLAREAHMRRVIHAAAATGRTVAAVIGAFHAPALLTPAAGTPVVHPGQVTGSPGAARAHAAAVAPAQETAPGPAGRPEPGRDPQPVAPGPRSGPVSAASGAESQPEPAAAGPESEPATAGGETGPEAVTSAPGPLDGPSPAATPGPAPRPRTGDRPDSGRPAAGRPGRDGDLVTSLVPYSFDLLDSRSGYPAGIRDPLWQQAVFRAGGDPERLYGAASRAVTDVCRELRGAGHPAGTGEAAETLRLAGDLARLRGLPAPGRGELLEAVTTVLGQGELLGRGRALARALDAAFVGTGRGRLSPGTPRSGLGPSVERELAALRLPGPDDPDFREVRLEPLRSPLDGRREVLLQRLLVCGASYGDPVKVAGTGDGTALGTKWRLKWTPSVQARLDLAGVRGVTVAQACAGTLRAAARREAAEGGPTCAQILAGLAAAARCELPDLVGVRLAEAAVTLPASATLPELLEALDLLDALHRGHLPGATDEGRTAAAALAAELLEAAVRTLPGLAGSEDPADAAALVALADRAADRHLGLRLDGALAELAGTASPVMQGAALAVRALLGLDSTADLGGRAAGWIDAAADADGRRRLTRRLAGLLTATGPLLQASSAALDPLLDRIETLGDQEFLDRLPALRGGFDVLAPAARGRLLDTVAGRLGERPDLSLAAPPALLALWAAADAAGAAALKALPAPSPAPASGPRPVPAASDGSAPRETGTTPPHRIATSDRWRLLLGREHDRLPDAARRHARALDELYGAGRGEGAADLDRGGVPGAGGGQQASFPTAREWAGELEALFGADVREEVLAAAADAGRTDVLTQLDPSSVRPSVELLTSVLSLAGGMPEHQLARLRPLVKRLVEELARELATRTRPALSGLTTPRPTRRPGGRLDLARTLRANLAHTRRTADGRVQVVPERPVFSTRVRKEADWRLILVVDVSGSMEASVVWSALTAAVLGGVPALSTHFLAFSTDVVDLTDRVDDPLSLLLEVRVGGGTHIAAGLAHARSLITVPSRTLVVVVSDFEEGYPMGGLLGEVRALAASGAHLLGCAALDDSGAPRYSVPVARQLVAAGMPVAALSPLALARWVGDRLRGEAR
ncbi:DUF5682 family protein [Streptomyces bambusae]|uniref:vWA domain-containing protein n=1 Tax=Streptomyces bambusae TaxID=1550616 RepID=UPI001CFFD017|nr:DUF5682 family protein [Streptomyces bambusae]MCB5169143.1 DUF5682 family protein [Streptomyces bambusae]